METFFTHSEINARMRQILVKWLIEVCCKFKLCDHTLELAIFVLDAFCKEDPKYVNKKNFQLLGVTCMQIAAKIHEEFSPMLNDYIHISGYTFTTQQMLDCEYHVLHTLNFDIMLTTPSLIHEDNVIVGKHKSRFYMDAALLNVDILYKFETSDLVDSCIELGTPTGKYWSECMDALKEFTKTLKNEGLREKYDNTRKRKCPM